MTESSTTRPTPFAFHSFAEFLLAYVSYRKNANAKFSYRTFAKEARLAAGSYVHSLAKAKRLPTREAFKKIVSVMGLTPDEKAFASLLVERDETRDAVHRKQLEQEMQQILRKRSP